MDVGIQLVKHAALGLESATSVKVLGERLRSRD
jgi:hypothetical protein